MIEILYNNYKEIMRMERVSNFISRNNLNLKFELILVRTFSYNDVTKDKKLSAKKAQKPFFLFQIKIIEVKLCK